MDQDSNLVIEYTRFIDSDGTLQQTLPDFADDQCLLSLYQYMLLTRCFDDKARRLQKTGKLYTYAPILGQEAVSVGIGTSMKEEDIFCPFYRDCGAQLIRGVAMSELFNYWSGNEWGNHFRHCQADFPICVPIATQLLHAAGIATAFKLRQKKQVAIASCGDGATSKGDFYEALNLAGAWQLPLIVVINNNQWAISVPREKQTYAKTLAQKAIAAGFCGEQVDGNDVVAVKFVIERAIHKARTGGGPSLIEALSYRLSDHTTSDDATRYRSSESLQQAWQQEPLSRLRKFLLKKQLWSAEQEQHYAEHCAHTVATAVHEYLALPKPALTDLFDYQYATLPIDLSEQRIDALALLKLKEIAPQ